VDIDFFTTQKLNKTILEKKLAQHLKETHFFISPDRIHAEVKGLKVELYDDWLVPFKTPPVEIEGLRLASLTDLAAFKLSAITGRREKKDYIDLFFLFTHLGLEPVLSQFRQYDPLLSSKSILFALSEVKTAQLNQSVMPDMLKEISWAAINSMMLEASRIYLNMTRRDSV
jgi:hypothetical protein